MGSTFAEIVESDVGLDSAFRVLRFCQEWVREHVGANLKSLNFLFSCGLLPRTAGTAGVPGPRL